MAVRYVMPEEMVDQVLVDVGLSKEDKFKYIHEFYMRTRIILRVIFTC